MRIKEKIKGDNNRREAYIYLTEEKGLEPHIAAAMVGNLMQESYQLDKTWEEGKVDDVGSMGVLQWHGDRLKNLYKFYKKKQSNYTKGEEIPLTAQLDFMVYEATEGDAWMKKQYEKVFSTDTTKEAALNFSKYVLRPHKDYAHNEKRVKYATNVYNTYSGAPEEYDFYNDPENLSSEQNTIDTKSEAYAPKQEFEMPDYTLNVPPSAVQVPYLAPYGEEQDTSGNSTSSILDEAISKIDRRKTDMATLQKIMKANEVQYIDPNESVVPEPNSYGYPNMQEGGEIEFTDQFREIFK